MIGDALGFERAKKSNSCSTSLARQRGRRLVEDENLDMAARSP